jgi:N-acetylglucosamine malate deacetylase 1
MTSIKKSIIVFAPHPDDETFGCGGTIAKNIDQDNEVFVVILTDGANKTKNSAADNSYSNLREEETRKAMGALGVSLKNLFFLHFEDGKLGENIKEAEVKVAEIIERVQPTEIYFSHKNDGHPDHKAAALILQNCLEKNSSITAYQYSISQKLGRLTPIIDRSLNVFSHKLLVVDISKYLDKKALAMAEYKSQISINEGQQKPVVKNYKRFLKEQEVFTPFIAN